MRVQEKGLAVIEQFAEICQRPMTIAEITVINYIAGSLIRSYSPCDICKDNFEGPKSKFIEMKEYNEGALKHPSAGVTKFLVHLENIFRKFVKEESSLQGRITQNLLSKIDSMFLNNCHLKTFTSIATKYFILRMKHHIKIINAELNDILKRKVVQKFCT